MTCQSLPARLSNRFIPLSDLDVAQKYQVKLFSVGEECHEVIGRILMVTDLQMQQRLQSRQSPKRNSLDITLPTVPVAISFTRQVAEILAPQLRRC